LRHAWTGHVPQVDIKLQQPWRLLQRGIRFRRDTLLPQ
jgi:hypothetical protein